jgi:SAM-dependent methyltransferase
MKTLLLPGRWHALARDQESALRQTIADCGPVRLVFVITAADQSGTKRNPLKVEERSEIVRSFAESLGRPFEIHFITDTTANADWVAHLLAHLPRTGRRRLTTANTVVVAANPDVVRRFQAAGFRTLPVAFQGALPVDVIEAVASRRDWQRLATPGTVRVYREHDLERRIRDIFADVLLTEDGELSTGRDFRVYAAGMDASLALKITDICPHVVPGLIADKGCGTGSLLVHLSQLFPDSQIVGLDLSSELLRLAESQHYPNHNVSIVRGNILKPRFRPGTVSTAIFSSVIHELYSYNGYDRDQVRLALRLTRRELQPGGRVIIRDGVSPPRRRVWMRCDGETEERFRKFAREFKGKSRHPGLPFRERKLRGRTWFLLSMHSANEFLSKKDYLENWAIEVNEEFGVFSLSGWRRELRALGFRVLQARSYLNGWILENRYRGRVWLHADAGDRPGELLPFPDTTAVLVAAACGSCS